MEEYGSATEYSRAVEFVEPRMVTPLEFSVLSDEFHEKVQASPAKKKRKKKNAAAMLAASMSSTLVIFRKK